MTVSREWPKTIRNTSFIDQELINVDTSLCLTGTLSNLLQGPNLLPANTEGGGVRSGTIHHIPIYPTVIGHIPLSNASFADNECSGIGASVLSYDQATATVHLQQQLPPTIHHQFLGATTGQSFLNLAFGGAAKLVDQKPVEGPLFSVTTSSAGAVASVTCQNEKQPPVPSSSSNQAAQTRMADESLDQKYFVFNTNIQQALSSSPPSLPHNHHQLHGTVGGGSLNVLSLSAQHTHHSIHQSSLPVVCTSATGPSSSTLSAMDALHTAKEQKVSV